MNVTREPSVCEFVLIDVCVVLYRLWLGLRVSSVFLMVGGFKEGVTTSDQALFSKFCLTYMILYVMPIP